METWKEQGIPLHVVLRGIEQSFDSFEAKPRKRTVKSLLYCQEEVEAQFAEWVSARVGAEDSTEAQPVEAEAEKAPFSHTAVTEYLEHVSRTLEQAAAARKLAGDIELSEALERAYNFLKEIRGEVSTASNFDARKIETSLTGLERMLNESILFAAPAAKVMAAKMEVQAQLKDYRKQMEPSAYKQTLNHLLLKRLREEFCVPRLSLFYI